MVDCVNSINSCLRHEGWMAKATTKCNITILLYYGPSIVNAICHNNYCGPSTVNSMWWQYRALNTSEEEEEEVEDEGIKMSYGSSMVNSM